MDPSEADPDPLSSTCEPRARWAERGAGRRYAFHRWRSARRAARDPRLVERALETHLGPSWGPLLDAPCGTGRLRERLEARTERYVGLDVSSSMLRQAGTPRGARALVRGDLEHLPFEDARFEAVVCCRLLHHLRDPEQFRRTVCELVRVSSDLVVASFWDAAALPARRRVVARGRRGRTRGRTSHAKRFVRDAFEHAGAEVIDFRHSLRFLSRQTFAVARTRGAERTGGGEDER